jgi:hypothetical protein
MPDTRKPKFRFSFRKNNLRIKYSAVAQKWKVFTANRIVLEEFDTSEQAFEWASGITDYLSLKTRKKLGLLNQ